jgi:hypothetical protein
MRNDIGIPRPSTTRWILLVSPARDRVLLLRRRGPRPRRSGTPHFLAGPDRSISRNPAPETDRGPAGHLRRATDRWQQRRRLTTTTAPTPSPDLGPDMHPNQIPTPRATADQLGRNDHHLAGEPTDRSKHLEHPAPNTPRRTPPRRVGVTVSSAPRSHLMVGSGLSPVGPRSRHRRLR